MSVEKYQGKTGTFWKVDEWLTLPDGRAVRFRKRKIPTREQALALVAKKRAEAFEGRYFDRAKKKSQMTVAQVWELYAPINERDNKAWKTEQGRARYVVKHLGKKIAQELNQADIDQYRTKRLRECTRTGKPPAPSTLDREVEILKRTLNYAVRCGRLSHNPILAVKLLRKPNVRRSVVDDEKFARLHEAAPDYFRPILLLAYDTGMRRGEVLKLQWSQVDLKEGVIRLTEHDTKTSQARIIYLTGRALQALKDVPVRLHCDYVFPNPETGKSYEEIRKVFRTTCKKAELEGLWFHDLRRSFVTNARRRGVPESVVMKMSGHKTRAVFDRYNVVSEDDLKDAVRVIEDGMTHCTGQELDKVGSEGEK